MNVIKCKIDGLIIIEPTLFGDSRGYFFESFNEKKMNELGIKANFIQDNQSKSCHGVIRGLHYQLPPYARSKLVRVLAGEILDVCVDIRENSPSFGHYETIKLSSENQRQLFVPKGFAHGFSVLSETAVFSYKVDNFYSQELEEGIRWDDPQLNIDWHLPADEVRLSEKDKTQQDFANYESQF